MSFKARIDAVGIREQGTSLKGTGRSVALAAALAMQLQAYAE